MRAASALSAAYRPLFTTRRARWLVTASLVGRLSTGAYAIPLILLIQGATHSYALAGAVEATNLAAAAVTGPARGRALDRLGSTRVVPPIALAWAIAIAAIWPVAGTRTPWAILLVAAAAGIATPALPTAMRRQWQTWLGVADPRLAQAYAFESLAQVAVFVVGPLIAAAGIATLGPGATLAATAGLLLAGALPFAVLAAEDRAEHSAHRPVRVSPIRVPGVRTLVAATVAADAALGIVDITVVAFAKQHSDPSAAGLLLSIFCLASVGGGAACGALHWTAPARRRLPILTGLAAILYLPLTLAASPTQLAGLLALAGAPFAAQWTTSYLALDLVAPAHNPGEAMSWISAANATGVGAGYILAGAILERAGTTDAFLTATALLALATLTLLARQTTLAARP